MENQVVTYEYALVNDPEAKGFIGNLNEEQYNSLIGFKRQIIGKNILKDFADIDDPVLLRFLRARKFVVPKSLEMFENYLTWRREHNVDELINFKFDCLKELKKFYPHGYHKTDKIGRPVYIEIISKIDLNRVFELTDEKQLELYYIREYERLLKYRYYACSKAAGTLIEQSVTVLDLKGVGMSIVGGKVKKFVQLAAKLGQDYYPEILGQMFMINTSGFFSFVFNMIKGFIDKKTVSKMRVLGDKYMDSLLGLIDIDNIPSFLGGNCTCRHIEGGCLFADIGPWNPKGGFIR